MGKKYIKCPRCELNYILEGEDYCEVCKNEMKHHEEGDDDELLDFDDMELCPVCGTNYIREGQAMCEDCLAKSKAEGGDEEIIKGVEDDTDSLVSTDADENEDDEEYNSGYSEMYKTDDEDDSILEADSTGIDFAGDDEDDEADEETEEAEVEPEDDFDDIGNIDDIDDDEDEDEDDYDLDDEDMLSNKKKD